MDDRDDKVCDDVAPGGDDDSVGEFVVDREELSELILLEIDEHVYYVA